LPGAHFVGLVTRENMGQRALARSVRTHDGVYFAGTDIEIHTAENLFASDRGVKVPDVQHHPILPSRLTLRSFCASTANSIASSLNTSRQNPLTIIDTASSSRMPRWRQ